MLKPAEAVELQEKLIIIYKYISQEKLLKKIFFNGLNSEIFSRDLEGNPMVKKLIHMDNALDFLEESIMELADITMHYFEHSSEEVTRFEEVLNQNNLDHLCKKYGLKDCQEIEKLELDVLIRAI